MTGKEIIIDKGAVINEIAEKHGAYDVRVFGSFSRGDATDKSDIDLLVKTKKKTSPWFPGGLIAELEEVLGIRVDIVTEKGLNNLIRERVFKEAIPL